MLVEALPYIQKFRDKIILVKFGGSAMEDPETVHGALRDIAFLAAAGLKPILVHGGGKAITAELKKQNIEAVFINGLRYTCAETIKVVDRVLHNPINAGLVQFLQNDCGAEAVAVSGKNILRCERITTHDRETGEERDLGFVGAVVNVDTAQINWILNRRQIPVITPLACNMNGQVFNINADMAACVIAAQIKLPNRILAMYRSPANPEDPKPYLDHFIATRFRYWLRTALSPAACYLNLRALPKPLPKESAKFT